MTEKMTISRLASAADVNVETVRFYQRTGLIDEPARPYSGYRTYGGDDVRRIRFIKRAQRLGFTLDEIASLLKLEGSQTCAATRDLAARKLAMVEAKLKDLLAIKTALAMMVSHCDSEHPSVGCPIIQALLDD
ncbi:Hg(II)-responsive transcriptional regulator [Massilia arenosa]|uniref:Mercuric resistance operon regulatory protein n=1 Tax=Zemynaea arenosa TaxID=2561931 RepID=A0A4Y9S0E0_9BURK|nr:Hg(II)-responsive transcriptional regulator [Massilia arenosa]TFW13399.1 Hg(II)-responsive transcriptional regulator [Massilia arenosa]